jgi:hypothetical protein
LRRSGRDRDTTVTKLHIETTINGDPAEFLCDPHETLLSVLRTGLGLTGTKEGCATGDCGACSILLEGRLVPACLVLAPEAQGRTVTTASAAAEVSGACGASVRHLHAGIHCRRQGAARREAEPERGRSAVLARRQPVPVHWIRQDHPRGARRRL